MMRSYYSNGSQYLIHAKEEAIEFEEITAHLITNRIPVTYIYHHSVGKMMNDIVYGIMPNRSHITYVSHDEYQSFLSALQQSKEITEQELTELLSFTVEGDYSDPF